MNIEHLQKIDTKKMYQVYDNWSEIARSSLENNPKILEVKDIDHIIFSGMGLS